MTEPAARTLATSPDGQWAVARQDRQLVLLPGAGGTAVARLELPSADVDVALVGPPTALVVLSRGDARGITLYSLPFLEAAAGIDLDINARIAGVSGPRFAVIADDGKHVAIVRSAGRALATQKIEIAGSVEFIVGLERNQMLFGLPRKLEVWDAVSGRPLLRAQFPLPPPPRQLGSAAGHLWAATIGSDEIFVYRLSDGRPFKHHVGSAITDVISHPASPIVVLVTAKGLVRVHAYAHSVMLIDGVPERRGALAQHVVGDEVALLGFTDVDHEVWRLSLDGAPAAATPTPAPTTPPPVATPVAAPEPPPVRSTASRAAAARWRDALATYGDELVRGGEPEQPTVAVDTELGELAHRLELGSHARRALTALYALHLVGESALPIATLAKIVREWPEALGQGELGELAMLRRKRGRVGLRTAVTDLLDGAPPRSVRLVGTGTATPRAGAFRVSRDSRSDAEIETALAAQLGRIAIACGPLDSALLEARMHGATAIAYSVPAERPRPWPRDAGLVLVLYGTNSSWVADLPALAEPTTAS